MAIPRRRTAPHVVPPVLSHPAYLAVKAGAAALLAVCITRAAGLPDHLSATFVAVICISPTVYSGLRRGIEQLGASLVGGAVASATSQVLPLVIALPLSLLVVILMAFRIGMSRGYLVASFTVLYVFLIPGPAADAILEGRMVSVTIGVGCALFVNAAVSSLRYRAVFARRLHIARALLADHWVRLAKALEGSTPSDQELWALFEQVFVTLRQLHEELSLARAESAWLPASTRRETLAALEASREMLTVAHYGKDLCFRALRAGAPQPAVTAWVRTFAERIREGARGVHAAKLPPPWCYAAEEAAHAWNRALDAEARFRHLTPGGEPTSPG